MENITLGQIIVALGSIGVLGGMFAFLAKIYKKVIETNQKIEKNDTLTKTNLKATKVILNHFIENKIGNGEFKKAREEIDDVLIEKKVI